jgi:hypothetical protein
VLLFGEQGFVINFIEVYIEVVLFGRWESGRCVEHVHDGWREPLDMRELATVPNCKIWLELMSPNIDSSHNGLWQSPL